MESFTHAPCAAHIPVVTRRDPESSGRFGMGTKFVLEGVETLGRFLSGLHEQELSRKSTKSQGRINKFPVKFFSTNKCGMSCATSEQFERFFVGEIVRMHQDRGMSFSDFARAVWPEDEGCVNRWRRIRNYGQVLSISDMHTIACVLGYSTASLVFEVSEAYRRAYQEIPTKQRGAA